MLPPPPKGVANENNALSIVYRYFGAMFFRLHRKLPWGGVNCLWNAATEAPSCHLADGPKCRIPRRYTALERSGHNHLHRVGPPSWRL